MHIIELDTTRTLKLLDEVFTCMFLNSHDIDAISRTAATFAREISNTNDTSLTIFGCLNEATL